MHVFCMLFTRGLGSASCSQLRWGVMESLCCEVYRTVYFTKYMNLYCNRGLGSASHLQLKWEVMGSLIPAAESQRMEGIVQ